MRQWQHRHLMFGALACTVACVALSWLLAPSMFCLNDDSKMQLILSGAGTAAPSAYAVFINIVLGGLVSGLFGLAPGVPWWFVWQVACVIVSVYLWNLCLGHALMGQRAVVVATVCLLSSMGVFMYALSLVSFTITAGALTAAVVMLQCVRDACPELGKRHRYAVYEALLVVAAFCTRPSAAIAALSFGGLLLVPALVRAVRTDADAPWGERVAGLVRTCAPLVVGVCLAFACNVAQNVAYGTPVWKEFRATNSARHQYMDYPHDSYEENPALYDEAGWSDELYTLVRDEWMFMDERVTPEAFLTLSTEGAQTDDLGLSHIFENWRFGEGMFDSRTVAGLVVLIALCAVLLCVLAHDALTRLLVLAGLAAAAAEIYYLEMQGRLVVRVALAVLLPAVAYGLGLLVTRGHQLAVQRAEREADGYAPQHGRAPLVLRALVAVALVAGGVRLALAAYHSDAAWKLDYALLLVMCAVGVVLWGLHRRGWMRYVVVGGLLPLLVTSCLLAVRDIQGTLDTTIEYERWVKSGMSYVEEHPDEEFFLAVSLFSSYDPWRTTLPENMTYIGGWEFYLPSNLERMAERRGSDAHNYDMLLRDGTKVMLLTEEQADQLEACIEQVCGYDVAWEHAGDPDRGVVVAYRRLAEQSTR